MLNPDGAYAYTRENANGIDLNRDAIDLNSKESIILSRVVNELKPDFAFNLHDKDSFYNVSGTNKASILSFLAPSADKKKTITQARKRAMSVIHKMYLYLQNYIPNQIGRYNDTFCDNCFGDMIQKWGFPTILIESGYFPEDENREKTREIHFFTLLDALYAISSNDLPDYKGYFNIPNNEKKFYDIRFDNILYNDKLQSIAIRYNDKMINGVLSKYILTKETIADIQLKNKLFHKVIDAKGIAFSTLDINNYF